MPKVVVTAGDMEITDVPAVGEVLTASDPTHAAWAPVAAGVPATRTINTTAPLAGGGDLSADRTLSITLPIETSWKPAVSYSVSSGVGGSGINGVYVVGTVTSGTTTTDTIASADVLHAFPFCPGSWICDSFNIKVTGVVAGSKFRLGLWKNKSDTYNPTDLYPGALLWDSGELSGAGAGLQRCATGDITWEQGKVYWAGYVRSSATASPSFSAVAVARLREVWMPEDLATALSWLGVKKAFPYAALDATFPTGGGAWTNTDGNIILLGLRRK